MVARWNGAPSVSELIEPGTSACTRQRRGERTTPVLSSAAARLEPNRWHRAAAIASAASNPPEGSIPETSLETMAAIWAFSARPFPVTDSLIVAGLYSETGRRDAPSAASTAPRAWAS